MPWGYAHRRRGRSRRRSRSRSRGRGRGRGSCRRPQRPGHSRGLPLGRRRRSTLHLAAVLLRGRRRAHGFDLHGHRDALPRERMQQPHGDFVGVAVDDAQADGLATTGAGFELRAHVELRARGEFLAADRAGRAVLDAAEGLFGRELEGVLRARVEAHQSLVEARDHPRAAREEADRTADVRALDDLTGLVRDVVAEGDDGVGADFHERQKYAQGPARRHSVTTTAEPFAFALPEGEIACQPSGSAGSVNPNSQRASAGDRLTQPCDRSMPKPACQNAPCSATLPEKYCVHGTSSIEYASSSIGWSRIDVATCLICTRCTPTGVMPGCLPVDTSVANTGTSPSYATSVCSDRSMCTHFSPSATPGGRLSL